MIKKFKNIEIYNIILLYQSLSDKIDSLFLPVKVSFYFRQNIKTLTCKAIEIDNFKSEIIKKYSVLEKGKYKTKNEEIENMNQEIKELMDLEQELEIKLIPLSAFNEIQLTSKMMEVFIPMILDEE